MKNLAFLPALAILLQGCGSVPTEEPETPAQPEVAFPANPTFPKDCVGMWNYRGDVLTLNADGSAATKVSVSAPTGNSQTKGQQEVLGKWGVEGSNLFLQLGDQNPIRYDFKVDATALEIGVKKLRFKYTRLSK